ncbi:MAG: PAS domain S-box protein [Bacteroidota bacterium]
MKKGLKIKLNKEESVYEDISFQALIENAPDGIVLIDREGRYKYISPSARRIFGYLADEEMLIAPETSTHPDDLQMVTDALVNVIGNPLLVPAIQYRFKNKDGSWRWIESRISNMLEKPGIESIVFNFRDISEKKKAEEAMQVSEEKFRMLLELATDAFFQGDQKGNFITVNTKAIELTGYTREELLKMNMADLFPAEILVKKPLNYRELQKGEMIKAERFIKRKDGLFIQVEMHSRAMPDSTYQSFLHDITDRKKAEAELERQRRFFEQMFLQSATSTQILDPEGWCTRINPKLSMLFGVAPENIEGKVYNIFNDSEIKKNGIDKALKRVFEEHTIEEWEVYFNISSAADSQGIKIDNKKEAWFANKAYPILDDKGELLNVIIQHEDISERKRIEEVLKIKEEQLLTLINTTHDIICFKDGAGRWLEANKADLDLFGLEGVDFYLKKDTELAAFTHPLYFEAFANCEKTDENAWLKGIPSVEDEIIPTRDGKEKTYEIIKTPLFNPDGSRKGLVVFGRDITGRKTAEIALKESEHKYRQIVDYSPDAIVIHNNNRILFANPATLKLLGAKSFIELQSLSVIELVHPDYRQKELERLQQIDLTGKPVGFEEEKFVRMDYKYIDVEIIGIPIHYEGSKAVQLIIRDISARKQAVEALRESEDKFRTLAESAPYAIMIYQNDHWVYTNPAGERISGYTAKELFERPFWELASPEYRDLIRERGRKRQMGLSSTPSYEFKIRLKNGNEKWVYLSGSSVLFKGKPAGIISVIDITERKQAEEAVQRERILLRTLIDNLPDTIYFKDTGCRKIVANRADLSLMGMEEESQALGKTDVDILGEEHGRRGYSDDKQVIGTGLPLINSEDDVMGADGKLRWMLTTKIPLHDENGKVSGLVGIGHDITEWKQAEQIQRVLFQISNAVLVTGDLEQLFLIIREQLGTLLDTTNFYIAFYDEKTDMLSSPYFRDEKDNIPEWPAGKSATGYVIRNKKSLLADSKEIESLRNKGQIEIVGEICQIWLGVPLLVDGKAIGALVVQSYQYPDAYSQKDVEMLEFVSHQISLSIQRKKAEQDIRDALVKAEESDRLKTAFLNNMSHEIRTPLNGILGFTSLLDDPDTTPEEKQYFYRIINQNGEQLLSIINDIISIATIEAGQEKIREGKANVNEMLAMLYEQFKIQSSGKNLNLNFRTSLGNAGAVIMTDETKLRQVLTNLIGNAIKFTEQGMVEFGCIQKLNMLELYVKDTGVGISPEMHQLIFERFRQANTNPNKEYGGNGLGLAISRAYVELLGGRIWLESAPGKGTTFRFTIPYNPVVETVSSGKISGNTAEITNGKGRTLLIAEDVYTNYQLLEVILKKLNYRIIHVENGLEAVESCRNTPEIDLVLMDMKMPEMDGYDATLVIKKMRPDLPVIAVTAYALGGDREKALRAGCDDYIAKPVKPGILLEILNRFLSTAGKGGKDISSKN